MIEFISPILKCIGFLITVAASGAALYVGIWYTSRMLPFVIKNDHNLNITDRIKRMIIEVIKEAKN